MRSIALVACVRTTLGPDLASQLLDANRTGHHLRLTFAGGGWERALGRSSADLERRLRTALNRQDLVLEIRSAEEAETPLRPPRDAPAPQRDAGDPQARLSRVAATILARRPTRA